MGREDISAGPGSFVGPFEGGDPVLRWRLEVGLGQRSRGCVTSMKVPTKTEVYGCVCWNVPTVVLPYR